MAKHPTFGQVIRKRREEMGLSLQNVADEAGITKAHLWDLEKDRQQNPTVKTVLHLAYSLAFEPSALALVAMETVGNRK